MIQYIFLGILIADYIIHIGSEVIENKPLRFATKPFLMPLVILYYIFSVGVAMVNWFLVIALIFGTLGDISLMIGREGKWFMMGLGSFLIGHIFYIITYLLLSGTSLLQFPVWGWLFLIPLIAITLLLYMRIKDKMGDLQVPTIVYIVVIFMMSFFAMLLLSIFEIFDFTLVYLGAILFIISDGIIAIAKFDVDIPKERVYIMITYVLAQLLITQGIILYQIP
ncbi:MAG: putative membrane protein [Promethearchaeota archaeon]|nr:MAG: putative membrane protein [Candidatus Lokiarchaeota archaeon]